MTYILNYSKPLIFIALLTTNAFLISNSHCASIKSDNNISKKWLNVKNGSIDGVIQELDTTSIKFRGNILYFKLKMTTADPAKIKNMFKDTSTTYAISDNEINCDDSTGRITKASTYDNKNKRISFETSDSAPFSKISNNTGIDVVYKNYCNTNEYKAQAAKYNNDKIKKLALAAKNGNYTAANRLGEIYYHGIGVSPDHSTALTLWNEATKHRHKGAIINMCKYAPEYYLVDSQLGHYCEELGMR